MRTWISCAVAAALVACDGDGSAPAELPDARAPLDAAAAADAAPQLDGAADAGGEPPPHSECATDADCAVPEGLLACMTCQDGSERCPEVTCQHRLCATRLSRVCPELEPMLACTTDADCALRGCTVKCQGDGRDACLRGTCEGGLCTTVVATCGLQIEACPPGTRAARECGECGPTGGCAFQVIGCFQTCESAEDCPAQQACSAGVCQFAARCD
jgi:hypothetical protein